MQHKQLKYNFWMSSKKILRLKTPTRPRQTGKSSRQYLKCHPRFADVQTFIKEQNHEDLQYLPKALISEINKLYHELEMTKRELESEKQMNWDLKKCNNNLQDEIRTLKQELRSYGETYELEKHNHRQLRAFYEKREKQWQIIVMQHKSLLEEYFYKNYNCQNNSDEVRRPQTTKKYIQEDTNQKNQSQDQRQVVDYGQKKQIRKLKRKSKENIVKPEIIYYYAHDYKLHEQGNALNASQNYSKRQHSRNPEADDLFDKIMRKTFYHFRQRSISLNKLKSNEDMLKLKHARTSTKDRLPKTLKKLQFQFGNEQQLQFFCDYIEQMVILEHQQVQGSLVYGFIMEKLQHIEALAKSSNSEIERFAPSSIVNPNIQGIVKNDPQMVEIKPFSQQSFELLLNSVIKPAKIEQMRGQLQNQGDWLEKIRYSESQLQNLSNIIYGGKLLGHQYFNIDDPPTVDVTMR